MSASGADLSRCLLKAHAVRMSLSECVAASFARRCSFIWCIVSPLSRSSSTSTTLCGALVVASKNLASAISEEISTDAACSRAFL